MSCLARKPCGFGLEQKLAALGVRLRFQSLRLNPWQEGGAGTLRLGFLAAGDFGATGVPFKQSLQAASSGKTTSPQLFYVVIFVVVVPIFLFFFLNA